MTECLGQCGCKARVEMVGRLPRFNHDHSDSSSLAEEAGIQLTARASSASCCEFNWSDLDDIIGKRRMQLNTDTIEKLARNRAVARLKMSIAFANKDASQALVLPSPNVV